MQLYIPLSQIKVEGRLREDLGDIEALAVSIRDNGQLQPIVVERIGEEYHLRAGGRRYAALTALSTNIVKNDKPDFYLEAPVTVFNEMPAHQRTKIELEENLRRKDMTWLEKVIGIVKYHRAARQSSLQEGEQWTQEMTGDLLGLDQASVSIAFTVYEHIRNKNQKVLEAESLTDAIKVIAADNLDAAQAERLRRIKLAREQTATPVSVDAKAPTEQSLHSVRPSILVSASNQKPQTVEDKVQASLSDISAFYHEGDSIDVLPKIAASRPIHHIICDPPYGIAMSNLLGSSIERIEETHHVQDNLSLLPKFLRVAFDSIQEDGFLCMWYDLDHHEKIAQWAGDIGWRVQRWPVVWCKTSPCSNQAAQCNVTKSTEVCYMFRRSEKSILKKKQSTNYILAGTAASATHPFTKPYEVWKYLIEAVSMEGQTIVDPFAGEGSSLAAAFKLKRTPIGIEIDQKHIASGLGYIQSQLNQKNILDDIISSSIL